MSMQPLIVYLVPAETAKIAQAVFPKGNIYMEIYDQLGWLYKDDQFRDLFAQQGQPAQSPVRLALATIMQFAEGLTDRQAADAIRSRIDWKYLLCLRLADPGFDHSVLSEFRSRLVVAGVEKLLLDNLLKQFSEIGLLKSRGRQRTDSTQVLAAIREMNRLERVGETLRHALNSLAVVAPDWLRQNSPSIWYERYSKRFENYRLPKSENERTALANTIGQDGFLLLQKIAEESEIDWLAKIPAINILEQMWAQQYIIDPQVRWRKVEEIGSPSQLLVSPYDEQARWSTKQGFQWVGYKVQITETCQPDSPNLITQVETTPATTPDDNMLDIIHKKLADKELLPSDHLVDKGYTDARTLVSSQQDYQVNVLGPVADDPSWQAKLGAGFNKANFVVDWEAQTVTCPAGKQSVRWKVNKNPKISRLAWIKFAAADCQQCIFKNQCTKSENGRSLDVRPRPQHEALYQRKQYQTTQDFQQEYRLRAGIEGTISQAVRRCQLRTSRYIGLAKTHLQMVLTAVALNLIRVIEWFWESPRAKTRISPFAKLNSVTA